MLQFPNIGTFGSPITNTYMPALTSQFWGTVILHLYISHNAPYLPLPTPQILHNLCFTFLLGIITVPREIENNAFANFGGQ